MIRALALAACCALGTFTALSISDNDLEGRVERVIDGDTFILAGARVRVWGIDAPEMRTPAGPPAKAALRTLIEGQRLTCKTKDNDRYKRVVAQCFLGNRDIAAEMVAAGHARDWPKYSGGYYGNSLAK